MLGFKLITFCTIFNPTPYNSFILEQSHIGLQLKAQASCTANHFLTTGDENSKKKPSDNCDSPGDSDTETLDVTIDLEDDDATVEREAGDSDDRDTVKTFCF